MREKTRDEIKLSSKDSNTMTTRKANDVGENPSPSLKHTHVVAISAAAPKAQSVAKCRSRAVTVAFINNHLTSSCDRRKQIGVVDGPTQANHPPRSWRFVPFLRVMLV